VPSNPEKDASATNLTTAPPGTPDVNVSYGCNYNSGTGLGMFGSFDSQDTVRESMINFTRRNHRHCRNDLDTARY